MAFSKSLDAYPVEFFEAFKQGAENEVRIELSSSKEATKIRHKMHTMRKLMREANHHLLVFANRCEIALEGATLIVRPAGAGFTNAFHKAGVKGDVTALGVPTSTTAVANAEPIVPPEITSAFDLYLGKDRKGASHG